ncbi:hypothetical protein [Streptomyces sp. NPDC090022]|uniref:hypothetical protein n=1 Tax=Streptomyces sp. NPDC090022 TaxID=3365920 RepID=UPI00382A4B9B
MPLAPRVWEAEVAAPAGVLYGLLADAARSPLYFPAPVHVERLTGDGVRDEWLVWSLTGDAGGDAGPGSGVPGAPGSPRGLVGAGCPVGGTVTLRTEHRVLDPARRRVGCAAGEWAVEALDGGDRSRVTLTGAYEQAWRDAQDLLTLASHWERLDDLVLCFEDSVRVAAPPARTYGRLAARAGDWPYRVCFPEAASGRVVGKRPQAPDALLATHTGTWTVDPTGLVTVRHHVVLRPGAVRPHLGDAADLGAARRVVRESLGRAGEELLASVRREAERSPDPVTHNA